MQYDPRAIANLILKCAEQRGYELSNLSIQKLLYFSHAKYLVRTGKPLVSGVFEAWEYGPVSRPVYDALKQYGKSPVTSEIKVRDPFSGQEAPPIAPREKDVVELVEDVVRGMGWLSAGRLVEISHAKDGPWSYVWNKAKTNPVLGNRITDIVTAERFGRIKVPLMSDMCDGDLDEATPVAGD
mgnify:CR=1 FL=1